MANDSEYLFELETWRVYALRAMALHAKAIDLNKGVAFVCVQRAGYEIGKINYSVIGDTLKRNADPAKSGDIGTNYFGVVMMKLAVMMGSGVPSGSLNQNLAYGEVGYKGGLVHLVGGYRLFSGYSGGTQEQDVEIAKSGMRVLLAKTKAEIK